MHHADQRDTVDSTISDRVRSACLTTSAAAMILIPTLGPVVLGTEEGAEDYDTEITPPDYAFAIWFPIFAGVAANAVQHAAAPMATINRRTGWWLAAAYGANAAWSVAAQAGRFRYTPFILPVAAGLAAVGHRRAQADRPHGDRRLVAAGSGLLLGWTVLASVVNVVATRRRGRFAPTSATGRSNARWAVAGGSVVLSAVIATSRRGFVPVALAGGWGLITSAANAERTVPTRVVSGAGAALVLGTAAANAIMRRRVGGRSGPDATDRTD